MSSPLLLLPQGRPYKATPWQQQMPIRTASQSFPIHSYPSTLTCLPHIHPPIIQGSFYSIHPHIKVIKFEFVHRQTLIPPNTIHDYEIHASPFIESTKDKPNKTEMQITLCLPIRVTKLEETTLLQK